MAFALAVFVIVPAVAPALGAGLIKFMPWRGTFVICAVFGVAIAAWSLTLPETLAVVPVGHVAATAAAVYATVTTAAGAVFGERLDKAFDGTVNPFSLAFAVAGILSLGMVMALRRSPAGELR